MSSSLNPSTRPLVVEVLDLWHAGSGRGQGRSLDAVVVVDPQGLPYLPGRQLKGLLRDAVRCLEHWGHVPADTTARLFGAEVPTGSDDLRLLRSRPGVLHVSNATLTPAERDWLVSPAGRQQLPRLFVEVFSTAMDDQGVAKDQTLRAIQMVVPMTLHATLTLDVSDPQQAAPLWAVLKQAAQLVQHVGAHRSRGAGRARLNLKEAA